MAVRLPVLISKLDALTIEGVVESRNGSASNGGHE